MSMRLQLAKVKVSSMLHSKPGNDGFLASYEISKIIVKARKSHNIGETVILPAVSAIISSVVKQNAIEITNSIPLSNSSVSRRIDEMVEDVEKQLIAHLQVKQFALQLDESTLRDNEALLLAYVRFNNEGPKEEMLFARSLTTDTKVNVAEIELSLQEPLIELQSDEITRAKSKDEKYNIWKTTDVATKYPLLWDKAHRISQILSKAHNRLDIVKRGDLRLSLTSIEPNIKKLVEKHQPHGSH
ncbi:hypothetical protein QYM36_015124 [Artemia franciscana]|uniref:Uncharacterized protein n=1 Tax=Artemia franciscana TaxID=6661 RepID=A0AA88HM01_ARTSF|nr:hypothetical protein QYM36_015124 [Artemia franciscana]